MTRTKVCLLPRSLRVDGAVEITGTVKWFDVSKRYGFIIPDEGNHDVLFGLSCLQAAGYADVYEGTRVRCEARRRQKGWRALRIISLDASVVCPPTRLTTRRTANIKAESHWQKAEVKWFNRMRGFGFLTCGEDSPDIFVHMETVSQCGLSGLEAGQYVYVRWGLGGKGRVATQLKSTA